MLDTSGLFAALTRNQRSHAAARAALSSSPPPLVLSPFVVAELDYFLRRESGQPASIAFLEDLLLGAYELASFEVDAVRSARNVMERYAALGVSLADASLVILADRYRTNRILTLDGRHFRAMQPLGGGHFELLPADG